MDNWQFWAMAGVITLTVIVILLQALRRGAKAPQDDSALRVYRDQLSEVDRDLARNVISVTEAERLRTEVSRRLLDADRALKTAKPAGGKGSALPAAVGIFAALCAGIYGYHRLGASGYADLPLSTRITMTEENYRNRPSQEQAEAAAPPQELAAVDAQFTELMTKLRAVVKTRPNDPQGLALLAKNEAQLGDFIASRKAYQQLVQVKSDTATVDDHLGLAQTMIVAAGGFVSPQAEAHLVYVLEHDPKNGLARYFSGLMFAQIGRFDRAFALWEPLLAEGPADAPWIAPIKSGLQDVADRAGIKYQLPAGRGPNADDVAAAGQMSAADRQDMIKTMVEQLEARLNSEGGPLEEWLKLINAAGVLGDPARAEAAAAAAKAAHPTDATEIDAALAAAQQAAANAPAAPKGPTEADVANAAEMTPQDRQTMISGMVGQLETRLYAEGGSIDEWVKLINALKVLGEKDRIKTAYDKAMLAFESDGQALARIEEAAAP